MPVVSSNKSIHTAPHYADKQQNQNATTTQIHDKILSQFDDFFSEPSDYGEESIFESKVFGRQPDKQKSKMKPQPLKYKSHVVGMPDCFEVDDEDQEAQSGAGNHQRVLSCDDGDK